MHAAQARHAAPNADRQTPYGRTGLNDHGFTTDRDGLLRDPIATTDKNESGYATATHAVGLLGAVDVSGVVTLLVTIILWRIKSNESPFLDDHGREAANFQISLLVYSGILLVLTIGSAGLLAPLTVPLGLGVYILRLIGAIRGIIFANRGCYYRYPMCLRFLG